MGRSESSPASEYIVHLKWTEFPNNPTYLEQHPKTRSKSPASLSLAVNPSSSGRVIINYPGYNEKMNGLYSERYKRIASKVQASDLASMVRSGNPAPKKFRMDSNLRKMVDYSIANSEDITGTQNPELMLMGFSAGAAAVAAIASSYERISRLLLISPAGNLPREMIQQSLEKFYGEVYILIGDLDEVVGVRAGEIYYDLATAASHKELLVIPNCNHWFDGPINDNVFLEAPFYAFGRNQRPKIFIPTRSDNIL